MANNVAWTWKLGPQLPIYIKEQMKEGQQKNHKNAADIHLYNLTLKGS
jgi:hypothetical protein